MHPASAAKRCELMIRPAESILQSTDAFTLKEALLSRLDNVDLCSKGPVATVQFGRQVSALWLISSPVASLKLLHCSAASGCGLQILLVVLPDTKFDRFSALLLTHLFVTIIKPSDRLNDISTVFG